MLDWKVNQCQIEIEIYSQTGWQDSAIVDANKIKSFWKKLARLLSSKFPNSI